MPHRIFAHDPRRDVGRRAVEAAILFCAIAAAYLAAWLIWPTLTVGAGGNDALFLADGARRIAAGQTPHVDFSLPTGVIPYLDFLVAERLLPGVPAYIGAHLIGFLLLAPLVVATGASLGRLGLAAFCAVIALAALMPFNVTLPDYYGISFHASYNRLGSAFAIACLAFVFRTELSGRVRGLLIGYALVFAFFLKIVFVGVVLAPVIVLALVDAVWRRALLVGLAAFAATLLLVQLTTGVAGAYVGDILSMSAINAGSAPYFLVSFVFRTFALQALVWLLIAWLLVDAWIAVRSAGTLHWRTTLATFSRPAAMAAAAAVMVVAESQATHGLEFTSVSGLLFATGVLGAAVSAPRIALYAAAVTLSAGALAIVVFENGLGTLLNRKGPPVEAAFVERFVAPAVVPATVLARAEARAALWSEGGETLARIPGQIETVDRSDADIHLAQWKTVDEAIAVLGDARGDLGPVATLANVDLFGLALGAAPARGVKVVHDVGRSIAPMTPDRARAYLAGARTVFAPTCVIAEAPGRELMSAWFATTLAAEFEPRRLTPCWTMHRRKAQIPAS